MSERNHDRNPKQQQAQTQDAVPRGRLHVNGAGDGPVSPASAGKGGGNKSPPGNASPPPGNGAEGARSLPERVTALETEYKHLATKADLEQGCPACARVHDVKDDLTEKLHATELRLMEKIQENKEELAKQPTVILTGVAILMTIAGGLAGFLVWLLG